MIALAMIFVAFAGFASEPKDQATISIQSGKAKAQVFHLSKDAGGILCKTEGIPPHHIEVKRLKTLEAPFRQSGEPPSKCEQRLTWESGGKKSSTCYGFGVNPVLDEVLRWCTSI